MRHPDVVRRGSSKSCSSPYGCTSSPAGDCLDSGHHVHLCYTCVITVGLASTCAAVSVGEVCSIAISARDVCVIESRCAANCLITMWSSARSPNPTVVVAVVGLCIGWQFAEELVADGSVQDPLWPSRQVAEGVRPVRQCLTLFFLTPSFACTPFSSQGFYLVFYHMTLSFFFLFFFFFLKQKECY